MRLNLERAGRLTPDYQYPIIKATFSAEKTVIYEDVLQNPSNFDFSVASLGERTFDSPVKGRGFVEDSDQITFASQVKNINTLMKNAGSFPAFQKAGPRRNIFHNPAKSRAGVVTCGGLCPGLNNVIKGLVTVLHHEYGIRHIAGFRYGYQGLVPSYTHPPLELTPELVDEIHKTGGTILGSSRGAQDPAVMVNTLDQMKINLLFCIGGDGTLRGTNALAAEVARRDAPISIVGIPKTIDNDLRFVEKTFGFETSVQTASEIVTSAHNEAAGAENGIAIVKLMGRDSGFIAAAATLANSVVDFCLVPEIEFALDGATGLLAALDRKLEESSHAVIVVAEGAGQSLFKGVEEKRDASGNVLKNDIGVFLKDEISRHFRKARKEFSIKYFDPSYHIRSVAAIASDAIFCYLLAENAVHAAMAGKTDIVIGHWNNYFTHVPIALATLARHKIDLDGALWKGVLCATRQNSYFGTA
jgi:6-phosphofructokinase 1